MRATSIFSLILAFQLFVFSGCDRAGSVVSEEISSEGGDTTARKLQLDFQEIELVDRAYLVFRQELSLQDVPGFLAIEADSLTRKSRRAGVAATGPMTSLFYRWDPEAGAADAAVALPVAPGIKLPPYVTIQLADGPALALDMEGSYERLSAYHYALSEELRSRGYQPASPSIEEYPVGPLQTSNPEEFRTRIIYPYTSPQ